MAVVVLLAGCGAKPELLRHYDRLDGATANATLELSVFMASPKAGESKAPIVGLSERAQAELVKALAERAGPDVSAKQLVASVMATPEEEQGPCAWADRTVLSKRVVFTLLGDLRKPADRVDKLEMVLELAQPERARFTSWDRFDSVYASFDIGSAKFTQTDKLTLGRTKTASVGDVERVLDIGAETSDVLEESAKYALRRMSLGGALTPSVAKLVVEGGPNVNLFGTTTATVSLKLTAIDDNLPVYRLSLVKDGKPAMPAVVTIERCQAKVAKSSSDGLSVKTKANAWIRETASGDSTVSEGDDVTSIRTMPLSGPTLQLATADDLYAATFGLVQCPPGAQLEACHRLRIEVADFGAPSSDVLQFTTAAAAAQLRLWLLEQTRTGTVSAVAGRRIGLAGADDDAAALTGVSSTAANQLRVARLRQNR
ncbi:MAG: hypothetical protein J0M00_02530 [Burkholderiales bacterium]|nr:hypothetical protein [Burkholderiales bacterium]